MDKEIFKVFEASSTTLKKLKNGFPNNFRNQSRNQIIEHYDEAMRTLQTLIRAKENDILYRKDLISMLERSKIVYDDKSLQSKAAFNNAKRVAPKDSKVQIPNSASNSSNAAPLLLNTSSRNKDHDLEIPLPFYNQGSRTSLDRRLSEFLKTFPNHTQTGMTQQQSGTSENPPLPKF